MSETTKQWTGWLFPDGSFWPCDYGTHIAATDDIAEYFDWDFSNPEHYMESNGFIPITLVNGLCFTNLSRRGRLTYEQCLWFKEKMEIAPSIWAPQSIRAINKELMNI